MEAKVRKHAIKLAAYKASNIQLEVLFGQNGKTELERVAFHNAITEVFSKEVINGKLTNDVIDYTKELKNSVLRILQLAVMSNRYYLSEDEMVDFFFEYTKNIAGGVDRNTTNKKHIFYDIALPGAMVLFAQMCYNLGYDADKLYRRCVELSEKRYKEIQMSQINLN